MMIVKVMKKIEGTTLENINYKKQPHFNAEKNDNAIREKKKEEMIEELFEQMSS